MHSFNLYRRGLSARYLNRMEKRKNKVQDPNAERNVCLKDFSSNKIFLFFSIYGKRFVMKS
jgi:hypothetical protein